MEHAYKNRELLSNLKLDSGFFVKLTAEQHRCTAHRLALQNGFQRVSRILTENGIEFILVKGLYLARHVYPEGEPRQFADHDLLVHQRDLIRTESAFLENGFELQDNLFNKLDVVYCSDHGLPRALIHGRAHYLQADLHTRLSIGPGPRFLASKDCWEGSHIAEIDGEKVRILAPESAMLHLCWHSLKHSFCRLTWIRDIWFFERMHSVIEGGGFIQLVKEYQAERVIRTVLSLTGKVFGDDSLIGKFDRTSLKDRGTRSDYFSVPAIFVPRREISARARFIRDISLTAGITGKVKYLFKAALPPPQQAADPGLRFSSRLNIKYMAVRFKTLFSAIRDFEKFKS